MFLEQQISILEWFLKDHVTLKTGVLMLTIFSLITGINYILKYIQIESSYFNLNISQYYCFCCILDQINAGLVSRREFFKKTKKISQKILTGSVLHQLCVTVTWPTSTSCIATLPFPNQVPWLQRIVECPRNTYSRIFVVIGHPGLFFSKYSELGHTTLWHTMYTIWHILMQRKHC